MADIVLATLNAKYSHPAFGLRYLLANLGELSGHAALLEFDIKHSPDRIAEVIASHSPKIVGLGVYIWNAALMPALVQRVRERLPNSVVILGGPEISYDTEGQPIAHQADYVICGEGDLAFADVARHIIPTRLALRTEGVVVAEPVDLKTVQLPYHLYSDRDLAHKLTYVESSRGCAFACDYCISAVGPPLRYFELERVLPEFEKLLARGARVLKFVDRTFNVNADRAVAILRFFRERLSPGMVLHLEMMPDRFSHELREAIACFPAGVLDLEIGVQTLNPEVAARIHRQQDMRVVEDNLRFLKEHTGAVLHVDLIAGLPGETWESIRAGFDRLAALRPHRIQLGLLKKLRGAPIARHDQEWSMQYDPAPPYALQSSRTLSRDQVQRIVRMAKFWERIANREKFPRTMERICTSVNSVWDFFMGFSDWFFEKRGRDHGIALRELAQAFFDYATNCVHLAPDKLAADIEEDYKAEGRRRDVPKLAR